MKQLYPLKFRPLLKEKVWGGHKLASRFGKNGAGLLGESWEISGVKGDISEVSNGPLQGTSLVQLIEDYGAALLGKKVMQDYHGEFPLLFKFIDASQDLSVQLHPDDEVAKERHDSFGKTEMWYIMDADEGARLILGFNGEMDKSRYVEHLSKGEITQILHEEPVRAGDAFFIASGTVHAIGAGVVLAEIQQTSNITYRIYDWDRPDIDGNMRELHTDLALDVINFEDTKAKLHFSEDEDTVNEVCTSPYFKTSVLPLTKATSRTMETVDSFVVYMCTEGKAAIEALGVTEELTKGETILIPAEATQIHIKTSKATLLEVTVP
ncbi:mannose-6-phosphate isomerase [Aureisphaera galaxeae]|uniref:type I phosphomannose isomerase catalytic subunit n=1 Tax=Aureisphaera galaxeae TaxID=1538023 RepID=UPI002350674F|nr:type I phosphomannose isomerase catalytic subunit [Aureisphaera galaxeae]MDC8004512.1 mannose-6-phosphate isomerase [Aureisphaera galaxeae]